MSTQEFTYSRWRHGGWYVHNVRYPSGAIGCVSRNFPDKKWRIVCHSLPFEVQPTFRNRDDAARAELALAKEKFAVASHAALVAACELSRRNVGAMLHMLPVNADATERKSLETWAGKLNEALAAAGVRLT